jgi:hypothetical protein
MFVKGRDSRWQRSDADSKSREACVEVTEFSLELRERHSPTIAYFSP